MQVGNSARRLTDRISDMGIKSVELLAWLKIQPTLMNNKCASRLWVGMNGKMAGASSKKVEINGTRQGQCQTP